MAENNTENPATEPDKPATPPAQQQQQQASATADVSQYERQIADLTRERDADRAQLHELRVAGDVAAALADPKLKIRDAAIVRDLINKSALKYETRDGKSVLAGLDAEIARIRTTYPTLFGTVGKADGGAGADKTPVETDDGNAFFREIFGSN